MLNTCETSVYPKPELFSQKTHEKKNIKRMFNMKKTLDYLIYVYIIKQTKVLKNTTHIDFYCIKNNQKLSMENYLVSVISY